MVNKDDSYWMNNKALLFTVLFTIVQLVFGAFQSSLVSKAYAEGYIIKTIVGTGKAGYSGDGESATAAQLYEPRGLVIDNSGNLLIADTVNFKIRKVDSDGVITTIAGNGTEGNSGDDGPATEAQLAHPYGMAIDNSGNLFIADDGNHRVRKVDSKGRITTIAGVGGYGEGCGYSGDNDSATAAKLCSPRGLVIDNSGNLFIADNWNNRVRKVDKGTITTIAGNGAGNYSGDDGLATKATLYGPTDLAIDNGNLFFTDSFNHRIRKVDSDGVITTIAGFGARGQGGGYSGDNGPATEAQLNTPQQLVIDSSGNLFIADTYNHRIRKVDSDGTITTIAGNGTKGYSGDNGPATEAQLSTPHGLAIDNSGNLFIADTANHRIRMLSPAYNITYNGNGHDAGAVPSDSAYYEKGTSVTVYGNMGNLTKANHTFAGWNTKADGSGITYMEDAQFPMGAGDMTLYAKWEANQYTVTYDGNGSTGGTPPNAMSYEYNANVIVAGQGSLVKSGYVFAGWNTAADGKGVNYAANDTFIMGSSPITFYAKWIEKQAPIVSDYQEATMKNTQVNGAVAATDADGDPLTYTKGSDPTNGTVQVNLDGTWLYTPNTDYVGKDSFTVLVNNGYGGSATSTITITIQKPPSTEAIVQTGLIVGVSDTKATFSGTVISDGDSPVTERGFVYSTDRNVTTADTIVISGSGTGVFTADVTGLNPDTTYYVRAYAENENGIAYGSIVSFLTTSTPRPIFNQKPVATNVDVTGTKMVGSTLTGSYAYQDVDGDAEAKSTYKWYQASDQNGTNAVPITGATNTTYKPAPDDIGKYIAFEVTPIATTGDTIGIATMSPYVGPIKSPEGSTNNAGGSESSGGGTILPPKNAYYILASVGGIIEYEGAKIVIPATALRRNFTVVIKKEAGTSNLLIQENSKLISDVYEITKDQAGNFDKAVTITLPFDKSKYDETNFTVSIVLFNAATKEWAELENVKLDIVSGKVSGEVNHFTKFAVLATKKEELTVQEQIETIQPLKDSFTDIKGHWAEKEIEGLVSKGIIKGFPDGTFMPNNNISRAEFASITVRALGLTCEQGKTFADTTSHWAKDCISTAVANGIAAGLGADKFTPNDSITREQMAVIIARAAKLDVQEAGTAFKDDTEISAWAKSFIAAVAKHQLVGGFPDGTFNPKGKATRAEAVVMITRLLK
ncbi:MAG TPA: cadherin-like domain-containing protein [Bacillus bacterium]|nr:cadherin-like domain-containing protein [Bacillus sp. (in: firmicutes)]